MSNILITGGRSGLGYELAHALCRDHSVAVFDRTDGEDRDVRFADRALIERFIDDACFREIDILINCAGVNRIGWLEDFTRTDWDEVLDTNAKGIFNMTRALLPELKASKGTVLNIISNASHVPMTCSAAYNASKGAAHILTQQLARELTRKYGITVFGVSPNKLAGTKMSRDIERQVRETRGWTEEEAKTYQLGALLAGEETPPAEVASFIAYLLSSKERHKYLTGCVLPYGA